MTLLADAAEAQPLVCVADDAQWLDDASLQTLAFVARRLVAESVALVFALREPDGEHPLVGLTELVIHGLDDDDARALLQSVVTGPVDEPVGDRIVAETHGNPLALIELPRGLTPEELAGGFGPPDAPALTGRIEDGFPAASRGSRRRPGGCSWWRRPSRPVIPGWCGVRPLSSAWAMLPRRPLSQPDSWTSPARCGSTIRSYDLVVYRAASPDERREAHHALADVADPASTRTAAPGTGPTPLPNPTTRSPTNWSARPTGRDPWWPGCRRCPPRGSSPAHPRPVGSRTPGPRTPAQTKQQAGSADAALSAACRGRGGAIG